MLQHVIQCNDKDWQVFDYQKKTLVIGLGETGYSCARFLSMKNCPFDVFDDRSLPPYKQQLQKHLPQVHILEQQHLDIDWVNQYQQIVVSPGISIRQPVFQQYMAQPEHRLLGDIAIFLQEIIARNKQRQEQQKKPVQLIAVTGSNGKSTVVTLVEKILNDAGKKAMAGGNLGLPALDLLEQEQDVYVLELSSFQLETIPDEMLRCKIFTSSTVLNVSADHMDRYHDLDDYRRVKERIYRFSEYYILNKNELNPQPYSHHRNSIYFSLSRPEHNEYGLINENGYTWLARCYRDLRGDHFEKIIMANDIRISGKHNYANIIAALALLEPFALCLHRVIETIKQYKGLAHRCEFVADVAGVAYYNDSKGTNVGATIAAINSFEQDKILIAGGLGKNADFSELGSVINEKVKQVILIGEDATLIAAAIKKTSHKDSCLQAVHIKKTVADAVRTANHLASSGDIVLFSPACASFDQYKNYIERGNDFVSQVKQLAD